MHKCGRHTPSFTWAVAAKLTTRRPAVTHTRTHTRTHTHTHTHTLREASQSTYVRTCASSVLTPLPTFRVVYRACLIFRRHTASWSRQRDGRETRIGCLRCAVSHWSIAKVSSHAHACTHARTKPGHCVPLCSMLPSYKTSVWRKLQGHWGEAAETIFSQAGTQ